MLPADGRTTPVTALISEVLPAPLGPINPTTVPAGTRNETSSNAATPP